MRGSLCALATGGLPPFGLADEPVWLPPAESLGTWDLVAGMWTLDERRFRSALPVSAVLGSPPYDQSPSHLETYYDRW